eukprot:TRINITY_DN31978_c0_g1_i1.p1 TRINITY_DN31978_c0_g1~~TRINITY_DN31978_c0_g1_i1.p1  ORF type:complete len:811 (+),score=112.50 TRINITY_DN31978_c0_g1_i1:340-2433(+)
MGRKHAQMINHGCSRYSMRRQESVVDVIRNHGFWQTWRSGRWVILPRPDKNGFHWMEAWDMLICFCSLFVTFYCPFEAALFRVKPKWCSNVNIILDMFFTVDCCLLFFTAYQKPDGGGASGRWITDPLKIARYYIGIPKEPADRKGAGWFWFDAVSVMPGLVDLSPLSFLMQADGHDWFVYIFRGVRMFRMLRVFRVVRVVDRWHAVFGFAYFVIELAKFFFISVLAVHLFACAWVMAEGTVTEGSISYHSETSWLSAVLKAKGDPCDPPAADNPVCVYVLALYWTTMTLTTVGYGDIVPQNMLEYVLSTIFMLVSGYVWAYIVGSVVTLLSSLDPYGVAFKQEMDDVNSMLKDRNIPKAIGVRLRMYMHEAKHVTQMLGQRRLMNERLSPHLQRELARCERHKEILYPVWWARGLPEDVRLELVKAMAPLLFGPQEQVTLRHTMLCIRKGLMAAKGRILSRGDCWGLESVLLTSDTLLDQLPPCTLSYLTALNLTKDQLADIAHEFPDVDVRLRRAQVRTAVMRAFVKAGKLAKELKYARPDNEDVDVVEEIKTGGIDPGIRPRRGKSFCRNEEDEDKLMARRQSITTDEHGHDALVPQHGLRRKSLTMGSPSGHYRAGQDFHQHDRSTGDDRSEPAAGNDSRGIAESRGESLEVLQAQISRMENRLCDRQSSLERRITSLVSVVEKLGTTTKLNI